MALKTLMLRKKIDDKQKLLDELNQKTESFLTREKELEQAIAEAETDEEQTSVEELIDGYEAEKSEHDEAVRTLTEEIDSLKNELTELERKQERSVSDTPAEKNERTGVNSTMKTRELIPVMDRRSRIAQAVQTPEVRTFLDAVKDCIREKRALTNVGLTVPDVFIGFIRENLPEYSKLYKHVTVRRISGDGRAVISGTIPEAVWTDACANLNELNLVFNDVEVGSWKVGGFFAVCNATLEDSDIDLSNEILTALSQSIGFSVDKAIAYGKGERMPLGIMTRLAQTAAPSNASPTARTWTDLHTSNIKTIAASATGTELFTQLTIASGAAKGNYSQGTKTWLMSETTKNLLIANSIRINSAGAMVAGVQNVMPIIGGEVEVCSFMPDNVIIGGYFDDFLLAERGGQKFVSSEHYRFLADETVFKGTARYDGLPVIAEAFVAIGLNGVTPTAAMAFAPDTANPAPALASLSIGSLALSPAFNGDTTTYTATAAAASNKVTAKAVDGNDNVRITVNGTEIENGGTATWVTGTNTVAVTVQDNSDASNLKVYTATVTKS